MSFKKLQPSLTKLDTLDSGSPADGPGSAMSSGSTRRSAIYIVVNEYSKRMQDELDMKPGDKIQVIMDDEEYNDGWYYGRNLRTNEEGLYPVIFTQEMTFTSKPGLMRAKSAKRVGSLGKGGSNASFNGSSSELSTPQVIETAAPVTVQQKKPVDRQVSVKSTMSDIDRALEELRGSSLEEQTSPGPAAGYSQRQRQSPAKASQVKRGSMVFTTKHLDVGKKAESSALPRSVSKDTSAATSTINGIETSELIPSMAKGWTPQQVTAYFISSGFDVQSASRFQQHKISGAILLELELAHLKELEINSFGTRFEIYKEIEALRELVNSPTNLNSQRPVTQNNEETATASTDKDNSKSLTAPVFFNHGPTYRGHVKKASQSLDDIDNEFIQQAQGKEQHRTQEHEKNTQTAKHKPASLGNTFSQAVPSSPIVDGDLANLELFSSPRRAPKPPSYPSPVAPPKSPVGNLTREFIAHSGSGYSPPTIYEKNAPSVESNYSDTNEKVADSLNVAPEDLNAAPSSFNATSETLQKETSKYKFPPESSPNPSSTNSGIGLGLAVGTPVSVNSPRSPLSPRLIDPWSNQQSAANQNTQQPAINHQIAASRQSATTRSSGLVPEAAHKNSLSGASFMDLINKVSHKNPGDEFVDEEQTSNYAEPVGRPTSSVYNTHSRATSTVQAPSSHYTDFQDLRRASSARSYFSAKDDHEDSSTPVNSGSGAFATKAKDSSDPANGSSEDKSQLTPVEIRTNSKSAVNTPLAPTALSPSKPKSATKTKFKRRSVSAKEATPNGKQKSSAPDDDKKKRSVSEAVKGTSMLGKNHKGSSKKRQTSAFMEGIRNISVEKAMADADCSGWMSKKGSGTMGTWKTRFFTLHGTRLSYFSSTSDTRERGLIDITAHCVVPAKEDDKLVSLYAASTGKGRYCFKLIPPHPGSKKGLTFTQPRVHYFAVDGKDDMRAWMAALIKTTIDIDTSVPVISSCSTTTVSLSRAQEMLSQAREETRLREQQYMNEEDEDQLLWEREQQGNKENKENKENSEEYTLSATTQPSSSGSGTMATTGFASPYLLASGVLSPNLHRSGTAKSGKFQDRTPEKLKQQDAHLGVGTERS
ncbi:related to protein BOI2 [Zygosaccharomyces bailii]|nr:related to protein BOI2 [Zygosaccharomyces bailii]